jgi:hypothetical protein
MGGISKILQARKANTRKLKIRAKLRVVMVAIVILREICRIV